MRITRQVGGSAATPLCLSKWAGGFVVTNKNGTWNLVFPTKSKLQKGAMAGEPLRDRQIDLSRAFFEGPSPQVI